MRHHLSEKALWLLLCLVMVSPIFAIPFICQIEEKSHPHFEKVMDLQQECYRPSGVVINDHQILMQGGKCDGIFDTNTRHFEKIPLEDLVTPSDDGPAVILDNKVVTLYHQINDEKTVERYRKTGSYFDPKTNRTYLLTGIPRARIEHTMHALKNGNLLVIGGDEVPASTNRMGIRQARHFDILEINPWTKHTRVVGQLPLDPFFRNHSGTSAVYTYHTSVKMDENRFLIIGGGKAMMSLVGPFASDSIFLFNRATGQTKKIARMAIGKIKPAALQISRDEVLIGGGQLSANDTLSKPMTEILNISTGRIRPIIFNSQEETTSNSGWLYRLSEDKYIDGSTHGYRIFDLDKRNATANVRYNSRFYVSSGDLAATSDGYIFESGRTVFQMPNGKIYALLRKSEPRRDRTYHYGIYKFVDVK